MSNELKLEFEYGFYWLNGDEKGAFEKYKVDYLENESVDYSTAPYEIVYGDATFTKVYTDGSTYRYSLAGVDTDKYYTLTDFDGTGFYTVLVGDMCSFTNYRERISTICNKDGAVVSIRNYLTEDDKYLTALPIVEIIDSSTNTYFTSPILAVFDYTPKNVRVYKNAVFFGLVKVLLQDNPETVHTGYYVMRRQISENTYYSLSSTSMSNIAKSMLGCIIAYPPVPTFYSSDTASSTYYVATYDNLTCTNIQSALIDGSLTWTQIADGDFLRYEDITLSIADGSVIATYNESTYVVSRVSNVGNITPVKPYDRPASTGVSYLLKKIDS